MVTRLFKISGFSKQLLSGVLSKNKLIEIKKSSIHGKGVFAKCDIPSGKSIIQYKGDIVEGEESNLRSDRDENNGTLFLFTLNYYFDIDGWSNGNQAKYINHSCKPNCEAKLHEDKKKYSDDEIWIESIRDIKKGEELFYTYHFDNPKYICKCGNDNCKGHM